MALALSFTNLAAVAPAVTASTADGNYPAANVRTPQRPFSPWKATVATDSWLVVDFGAAAVVGLLGLARPNFTACTVEGNATDDWGAPAYSSGALTVGRCPWNWRYQHTLLPAGFNYRYLRVVIPTQTPTEGAVFLLGGLWAGALVSAPNHFAVEPRVRTIVPRKDEAPEHRGWMQRSSLGDPVTLITAAVRAQASLGTPAVGDLLATWQATVLRQAWASDLFYLYLNLGDAAQGWPVRAVEEPEWTLTPGLASMEWMLAEQIGG